MNGVGVEALTDGIAELLPAADGDPTATSRAACSRSSGPRRRAVAYVRLFSGLGPATRRCGRRRRDGRHVTPSQLDQRLRPAAAPGRTFLSAGEMARRLGLGAVRVGDAIGEPPAGPRPSTTSRCHARVGRLRPPRRAVGQPPRGPRPARRAGPADQRPPGRQPSRDLGLALRRRPEGGHPGDARARLRDRGRLPRDDDALHRAAGQGRRGRRGHPGQDEDQHHRPNSPFSTNPFKATLGLRVEPAPPGSGIEFALDVDVRLVPLYLYKTTEAMAAQMEAYVREALEEGLCGWQVTDCRVTMWDCGYASPVSTPADFRRLTQLVLATALDRAGTWVCEPLADLSWSSRRRARRACWPCSGGSAGASGPVLGPRHVDGRRRPAGRPGPRPPAPAVRADRRRGHARDAVRRLSADRRHAAEATADDAEPAESRGVAAHRSGGADERPSAADPGGASTPSRRAARPCRAEGRPDLRDHRRLDRRLAGLRLGDRLGDAEHQPR